MGPLFFISIGFAISLLVSVSNSYLLWWCGLVFLSMGWLLIHERSMAASPITIIFFIYLVFITINLLVFTSNWSHLGFVVLSYFLFGFLIVSSLTQEISLSLYRIIAGVFLVLAIWAIVQFLTGEGLTGNFDSRASTLFATPNSYAAAINIILLPLIGCYLGGRGSRLLYVVILILFSSLIATQSRGGWIAFVAGFFLLFWLIRIYQQSFNKRLMINVIVGFFIAVILLAIIKTGISLNYQAEIFTTSFIEATAEEIIPYQGVSSSGGHRLDLYRIALINMLENPLFGVGYYNYHYYLHRDMTQFIHTMTLYAHNDYLQIGLETGITGLCLLLTLIILIFWRGIKVLPVLNSINSIILIGALAGLASYFVHALADFVMYVPVLVLLSGAYIAMVNRLTLVNDEIKLNTLKDYMDIINKKIRPHVIRLIFCVVLLAFVFQPVFAQLCYVAANKELAEDNDSLAITLFELARRFASYHMNYYLTEANYWKKEVVNKQDKEAAMRADQLYRQAAKINRYDPYSRLERALLHRDYAHLLLEPANNETIINWLEYVLEWRPHYNRVQAEYVRTLFKYGQVEKARVKLIEYLKKNPKSSWLVAVHNEILP